MASISGCIHTGCLIKAITKQGTCVEIAEESGWHEDTVRKYMRQWHRMGIVYIERWEKRGRVVAPVYGLQTGYQVDAPRPRPMSDKERNRRWIDGRIRKAVLEYVEDERNRC